jgi:hypothetical protein
VLSAAGSATLTIIALYFLQPWAKGYGEEKGKTLARKEDLDAIVAEMRAVTLAQKEIELKLSGDQWQHQIVWNQKRDIYFKIFSAAHELSDKCTNLETMLKSSDRTAERKLTEEFSSALTTLTNLIPTGKLFLPQDAFKELLAFCARPITDPFQSWITSTRLAVLSMSNDLVILAKKDLGITE